MEGLKPSQTVLLYADSFEGNVDPVYGEEIIYAGFEMQEPNGPTGPETIDDKGTLKNVSDLARLDLYFPENPVSIIADALDVEETIKLNKQ